VGEAIERVYSELGRIDVLVCCAGVDGQLLRTVDVTDAEWKRVISVNVDGVFFANRAVLPGMIQRGYGRIVNVASIAGKEGNAYGAAYAASKAAVIALTKSIAKDVAGTGVLVNAVAPAATDTPMLESRPDAYLDDLRAKSPLGRLGQPEEVAHVIAFLANEQTTFVTGACYDVSGGRAT
jgi:3-oxoacyl-[acyl-carrier protein] reductase